MRPCSSFTIRFSDRLLGNTNRQIAQELLVSLSSVKTYVQRIIKKLEVSDRTQASVRAVEMGLLPEKG